MVDLEPAGVNTHGRRARADAAGLPLGSAAVQTLVPAPMDQVRRPCDPHLGAAKRRRRVGTMKRDILAIDSLGEQNHVFVLGTENHPVPIEAAEIGRRGQGGRRAMARDGDIGEKKPAVDRRDPRVFDSEFFQARCRARNRTSDTCVTERPSPHRTTRKCEMKVSRTRPSALRLTTRGSTGSIASSATQSITRPFARAPSAAEP